jgi:hypothetical protein
MRSGKQRNDLRLVGAVQDVTQRVDLSFARGQRGRAWLLVIHCRVPILTESV